MWKAVLFDLDGTLLPLDIDVFLQEYFRLLAPRLAPLVPPEQVHQAVMKATSCMIMDNNQFCTNEEVFWDEITRLSGCARGALEPCFTRFYDEDFPTIKSIARPTKVAAEILNHIFNKGLEVVIATNPIFPLEAIEERLRWAGIDHYPFSLITSLENMHYCKPNTSYYEEILYLLGYSGDQCIMVGNDTEEDLAASELGISTYLVTDNLIDRGRKSKKPDFTGTLAELKKLF